MKHVFTAVCTATVLLTAGAARAQQRDQRVEIAIYPILIEAPIFGASVELPSLPDGGTGQRGSTDVSLNTLYMAGGSVRAPRWFAEARGQWADLSATRAAPNVTVTTKARFFTARGGVTLGRGFSATAGVRRIWGALESSLDVTALGTTLTGHVDRVLYDPLVGVDWRGRAGAFIFEADLQGGGFGVGTDADVSGEFNMNWRFTPHTDLRIGYGFLYYKLSSDPFTVGSVTRTLVSAQTLHGPIAGFAIVF
jgi:hypothetical protein